jgi:hypothetical protein
VTYPTGGADKGDVEGGQFVSSTRNCRKQIEIRSGERKQKSSKTKEKKET